MSHHSSYEYNQQKYMTSLSCPGNLMASLRGLAKATTINRIVRVLYNSFRVSSLQPGLSLCSRPSSSTGKQGPGSETDLSEIVTRQYEIQVRCQPLTAVERSSRWTNHRSCFLPRPTLPARLRGSCLRLITSIQDADEIDGRPGHKPPRLHRERRAPALQVPRPLTVRNRNP